MDRGSQVYAYYCHHGSQCISFLDSVEETSTIYEQDVYDWVGSILEHPEEAGCFELGHTSYTSLPAPSRRIVHDEEILTEASV